MSHIAQDFFSSSRRCQGCILYVFCLGTNAEDGKKDKQDGIFFDRNRLSGYRPPAASSRSLPRRESICSGFETNAHDGDGGD